MEVIKKVAEMKKISNELQKSGKKIAFVPTMGYFHDGHLSLMKRGRELADIVITSLYVNPTQFAPNEDFEKYPRNFERDSMLAEQSGTDYLFCPSNNEMYSKFNIISLSASGFTEKFEGITRPHHFGGVATIVTKLFNIVKPRYALFGQKDYQQVLLIKQMVQDLFMDIDIIIVPTVRETDGLAMSSRNVYLKAKDREEATIIFRAIEEAKLLILNGENRRKIINATMHNILRSIPNLRIDYAGSADSETLEEPDTFLPGQHIVLLVAVYLGKTRLIDNGLVTLPQEPGVKKYYFEDYPI